MTVKGRNIFEEIYLVRGYLFRAIHWTYFLEETNLTFFSHLLCGLYFQKRWKVFICMLVCLCAYLTVRLSVCLFSKFLTLINILQMSCNSYMLLISNVAKIVLKMVCIRLLVLLQRHTKFSIHYSLLKEKKLSIFKHIYFALNIMKLTYAIQMSKNMFHVKK